MESSLIIIYLRQSSLEYILTSDILLCLEYVEVFIKIWREVIKIFGYNYLNLLLSL